MTADFDIAVVGSGFGGALLSMIARRLGRSVILLERGRHPRFAIGESTSPLANLLIEQLAERYDLPALLPLTAYGAWQRTYPEVVCGLKRGFTYFYHEAGRPFRKMPGRENELMVAASPRDEVSDVHWLRSDVDHFFVRQAIEAGAEYLDETRLTGVERVGDGWSLSGERAGQPVKLRARFLVDASGPRGFLSRALELPEAGFEGYPPTQTLYSHFVSVPRCDEMPAYQTDETPPYPIDDAALHHVFDGGWMWALRFDNGVTSAGIAVEDRLAGELGLAEGEAAWPRFLARFPTIQEQFAPSEAIRPFTCAPRLAYRCSQAVGEGWAMLPSAAGFVDPLFSTGIPLTLLGIERISAALERHWGSDSLAAALEEVGRITLQELDWTAGFVAACYAAFASFPHFAAFSMFYFAAASFSEMARRLERPHLARRFLAAGHPSFAPGLQACADIMRGGTAGSAESFERIVARLIQPLNVAGLGDPAKRNWYSVDLQDVIRGAPRLEYTPEYLREVLASAPWAQA